MKKYPKMKDSGIKWIGDIPKHWKIKKLKFLGKFITGLTYSPEDVTENNNGLLVLRPVYIYLYQKGHIKVYFPYYNYYLELLNETPPIPDGIPFSCFHLYSRRRKSIETSLK